MVEILVPIVRNTPPVASMSRLNVSPVENRQTEIQETIMKIMTIVIIMVEVVMALEVHNHLPNQHLLNKLELLLDSQVEENVRLKKVNNYLKVCLPLVVLQLPIKES